MPLAPVFFISHGAPTFAIDPGVLGPRLTALGQQLTGIKAVLVVSPHWQTRDVQVATTAKPETVHDFGGFPAALYKLQYPANGHPDIAMEAARLLTEAGFAVSTDARRGLDHGAWVPLMHLLPGANVPVFQVSMPHTLTTAMGLAPALLAGIWCGRRLFLGTPPQAFRQRVLEALMVMAGLGVLRACTELVR